MLKNDLQFMCMNTFREKVMIEFLFRLFQVFLYFCTLFKFIVFNNIFRLYTLHTNQTGKEKYFQLKIDCLQSNELRKISNLFQTKFIQ